MNTKLSPKIAALSAYVMVTLLGASQAMAQNLGINTNGQSGGNVARNLNQTLQGFGPLINTVLYLTAFVMLVLCVFAFKKHSDSPEREPLTKAFWYLGIAALAAGAPELLGTGVISLWGSGAQVVTVP